MVSMKGLDGYCDGQLLDTVDWNQFLITRIISISSPK